LLTLVPNVDLLWVARFVERRGRRHSVVCC
jgi:hypothetical protein